MRYIANFKWLNDEVLERTKSIEEYLKGSNGKIIVWKKENETLESFYNRIEEQKHRIFKSGLIMEEVTNFKVIENGPQQDPIAYTRILEQEYPTIAAGYRMIVQEQMELFAKKMISYGIDNISMGSDLENEDNKKLSLTAIWIRCSDKINRLKNLLVKQIKNPLNEEPITDAWVDICNYSIIAQLVHKNLWKR